MFRNVWSRERFVCPGCRCGCWCVCMCTRFGTCACAHTRTPTQNLTPHADARGRTGARIARHVFRPHIPRTRCCIQRVTPARMVAGTSSWDCPATGTVSTSGGTTRETVFSSCCSSIPALLHGRQQQEEEELALRWESERDREVDCGGRNVRTRIVGV